MVLWLTFWSLLTDTQNPRNKERKEFKQFKHQFSNHDEEVQILDVQEDKKDQEEAFSHPFQVQPSTPNEGEAKPAKPSRGLEPGPPNALFQNVWILMSGRSK